jgi:hypothetical protein
LACALQREAQGQQAMNAAVGYLILSSILQMQAPELRHAQIGCALVPAQRRPVLSTLARAAPAPLCCTPSGPAIILILNSFNALVLAFPLAGLYGWLEPELLRLGARWLVNPEQGFALASSISC